MKLSDERFTLLSMLVVGYATFLVWFAGYPMDGKPLDEPERDEYRRKFEGTTILEEMVSIDFEEFMQEDDGKSVALVARVKYRDEIKYPEAKVPAAFTKVESVDDAISAFASGTAWLGAQYGCTPLAILQDQGQLFRTVDLGDVEDEDEDDRLDRAGDDESGSGVSTGGWSQMWVLRIRARRDLLDILLELESSGLNLHRLAAIEKMEASILTNKSDLLFSIDLTLQMLVGFVLIIIFLLSELCFPAPPKEKGVKRKESKSEGKTSKKGVKGEEKKTSSKGTKDKKSDTKTDDKDDKLKE